MSSIEAISDYVLIQIFSYVNVKEISECSVVSRKWNRLANDSQLWKLLYLNQYHFSLSNASSISSSLIAYPVINYNGEWVKLHRPLDTHYAFTKLSTKSSMCKRSLNRRIRLQTSPYFLSTNGNQLKTSFVSSNQWKELYSLNYSWSNGKFFEKIIAAGSDPFFSEATFGKKIIEYHCKFYYETVQCAGKFAAVLGTDKNILFILSLPDSRLLRSMSFDDMISSFALTSENLAIAFTNGRILVIELPSEKLIYSNNIMKPIILICLSGYIVSLLYQDGRITVFNIKSQPAMESDIDKCLIFEVQAISEMHPVHLTLDFCYVSKLMPTRHWCLTVCHVNENVKKEHVFGIQQHFFSENSLLRTDFITPQFPLSSFANFTCLRYHHDMRLLLSGHADNTLRLWRLQYHYCRPIRIIYGHTAAITNVQFDQSKIVSASHDHCIKVWSMASGECKTSFSVSSPVLGIDLTENGLLTRNEFGQILLLFCGIQGNSNNQRKEIEKKGKRLKL